MTPCPAARSPTIPSSAISETTPTSCAMLATSSRRALAKGTDTEISRISGTTVAANVEIGKLHDDAGAGATITAGTQTVKLIANSLGSKLVGGGNNDTLVAGASADTLTGNGAPTLPPTKRQPPRSPPPSASPPPPPASRSATPTSPSKALKGSDYNDSLYGLVATAAILDGGKGADQAPNGGTAGDTFVIDDAGDVITRTTAVPFSCSPSLATYTLVSGMENLQLIGTREHQWHRKLRRQHHHTRQRRRQHPRRWRRYCRGCPSSVVSATISIWSAT